ncbi:hypothetical protein CHS0354_042420 [Potamilus streckersoni]|uniref:Uncharacterized protein n=1 Tax=Potamilus streckersoni TaxID=2493646 RepID=A0AAE0W1U7_9BIVA|nr:hypothetical protein CHS0354_042420 [Potamilus streckersoni]
MFTCEFRPYFQKCAAFGSKRAALNATVLEEMKQKDTFTAVPDMQWDDYNKDSLMCAECCTNELCNAQGCGEAGYPADSGPICYNCAQERHPDACNQIKMCDRDEACYLSYNVVATDLVYKSECTPKQSCQGTLGIVGRRQENIEMIRDKRVTLCHKCCYDNLCNLDNCTSSTYINVISNPPMTTDSVTIAPVFSHSVDGQWSAWTAWGICSQTCGIGGITGRQRTCNNPAPSAGGKDCVGGHFETHNCSGSQEPQVIQSAQNFTKPIGSHIVIPCLVSSGIAPAQATQIIWIAPQVGFASGLLYRLEGRGTLPGHYIFYRARQRSSMISMTLRTSQS